METWIIWALFSALTAGLYNFCLKVVAEKSYDSYMVTFYDYLLGSILVGGFLLYQGFSGELSFSKSEILITSVLACINVVFFSLSIYTRVESMRHIHTVIFYPLYKTFGPILVTIVSIFFFGEYLNFYESLGIIIGIMVPLMLITKSENGIQKNLFLGVILVAITAVLTTISSASVKELMIRNFDIHLFIFVSFFIGMFLALFGYHIHGKKKVVKYQTSNIIKFSFTVGFIHLASFYCFVLAMQGNLAIVFTINSFSILVPIILSIIFYGEHFNLKKGIVIALSIVSILLFI